MAAYDPSATPQQLWDLILNTNPYLKQGIIQAPTSMKLNLGEAIKDDWWEQATSEGKQATYGPRTLLVVKDKEKKELYLHYVPSVLRIPYTYINEKGVEETEYLLIAFAGGAGE